MRNQHDQTTQWKRRVEMALAAVFVVSLLSACATGPDYKPRGVGGVGYSEQQLAPNRFMVSFSGSSAIPQSAVQSYLMRRAAEVTLQAGYTHFMVGTPNVDSRTHYEFIGDMFLHGPDYARRAGLPLTYPNWPETRYAVSAEVTMLRPEEAGGNPQAIDARSFL